jgi:hypothetical protein
MTANGGTLSPGTFLPTEVLWYDGVIVLELGPTPATYDLITFATTTITNISDFEFLNVGGFEGDFAYSGNTLQFTVSTVPDPGTWSLVACAAVLGWILRSRRNRRTTRISS